LNTYVGKKKWGTCVPKLEDSPWKKRKENLEGA